jgi:hypothetical protein
VRRNGGGLPAKERDLAPLCHPPIEDPDPAAYLYRNPDAKPDGSFGRRWVADKRAERGQIRTAMR